MEREFSVKLEDSPGELARVTDVLQKDGVNLRTIAIEHYAKVVRVITSDPEKARQNLTESNMMFSEGNLLVTKLKDGPAGLDPPSVFLRDIFWSPGGGGGGES